MDLTEFFGVPSWMEDGHKRKKDHDDRDLSVLIANVEENARTGQETSRANPVVLEVTEALRNC